MKRLLPLLLLLLLLAPAQAEDDPEALFQAAHPGCQMEAIAISGDTAAAVMNYHYASLRTLCIAERTDGEWAMTLENDEALHIGDDYQYTLTLLPDNILEWRCEGRLEYGRTYEIWRSEKTDEGWQFPTAIELEWDETIRIHDRWCDGLLTRMEERQNVGDSSPILTELMPLPAAWTKDMTTLADFTLDVMPVWVPEYAFSFTLTGIPLYEAAKELLPDYTFFSGQLCDDSLHLVLDRPDGARVFVGVTYDGEWHLTESMPLPKVSDDFEAFNYRELVIPGVGEADLALRQDGVWGVANLLLFDTDEDDIDTVLLFGQDLIVSMNDGWDCPAFIVGEHPWGDVTTIDWASLPTSVEDAWAKVNSSGWAMVNRSGNFDNPLILHETPSQDGRYLGEYHSGAPVRVLEQRDDWARVDIFGVEGWMETESLAFGSDMAAVIPQLEGAYDAIASDGEDLYLCLSPGGEPISVLFGGAVVIGNYGDEWYHVYDVRTGQHGYVTYDSPAAPA